MEFVFTPGQCHQQPSVRSSKVEELKAWAPEPEFKPFSVLY